ncbi:MAG: magnesium-protoporphyrin IX monomethyl ester oxidative cyclase, partial [Ignavibacteria bacterium]
ESAGRWMPLSYVYLAGAVRAAGFEAEIYDAMTKQHTLAEIADRLREPDYDVLAMSAITATMPATLDVLREARAIDPNVITVLGGVHPTFCPEELFEDHSGLIDFILQGEGEESLPTLLRVLHRGESLTKVPGLVHQHPGGIQKNECLPFIEDLDALPTAWDLVDWEDYRYYVIPDSRLGAVSTSRGCTHECTFCSQQKFWKKSWRARRPERVVEEMRMLHDTYGVNVFLLVDEYPTRERDRWEELLDRVIHARLDSYLLMETRVEDIVRDADLMEKYRQAGIVHVYIGVEATTQETLDHIKKDISVEQSEEAIRLLHGQNMITETSFVLGFPWETPESIEQTLALAQRYGPDFAHFLAITPWPYADMYDELRDNVEVHDYAQYNLVEPILRPDAMTRDEVRRAIVDCYARYYMHRVPEYFKIKDRFKRDYLKRSMKLIMSNSFLTNLIKENGAASRFGAMQAHLGM